MILERWGPELWSNGSNVSGQEQSDSRGAILRRLDKLIAKVNELSVALADPGKLIVTGQLNAMRDAARYCLADAGANAGTELREIAFIEFTVPIELQVFHVVDEQGRYSPPDDEEYRRLQRKSDEDSANKLRQMKTLLERAKVRLEGTAQAAQPAVGPTGTQPKPTPRKPYSDRDRALFELIGDQSLAAYTNAELWKRYRWKCQQNTSLGLASLSQERQVFRCSLHRIRRYHGIPAPKLKKTAQNSH